MPTFKKVTRLKTVSASGEPVNTPLFWHYGDDSNTWDVDNQLLAGESIMIAPVTEYQATSREVYFPTKKDQKTTWRHLYTNETYVSVSSIHI